MALDPSGIGSLTELIQWTDTSSGGFLGFGIVLAFYIVGFMGILGRAEPKEAFIVASFVALIVALPLFAMGIFPVAGLAILLLVGVIGFFVSQ